MPSKQTPLTEAPKLKISDPVVFDIWVRAGGRCEFHGCNAYLLQDSLTTHDVKTANIAHIVARTKDGPRGDDSLPFKERNKIENLMLVCTKCHIVFDNKKLVAKFPKALLNQYKQDHEARIRYLTGLAETHETAVLRMLGNIRGDSISMSPDDVRSAVLTAGRYPRYLGNERSIEIDLQGLPQVVDDSYWTAATAKIKDIVQRLIVPGMESKEIKHLSVFALTRIPLLVYLGNALGDKVSTDFYQFQNGGWKWTTDNVVDFSESTLQKGKDPKKVALILSVSGKILPTALPEHINDEYSIHEISPIGLEPSRQLLSSKTTLDSFRAVFQKKLRSIETEHGLKGELHIFCAIPAPIAIICGRELLKDVSPQLHVYDRIGDNYQLALKIN